MDFKEQKIGVIGAGNMGGAIVRGLSKSELINNSDIFVSDLSRNKLNDLKQAAPGINISASNIEIVKNSDIIILAVKPWLVESIISEIEHAVNYEKHIFISIAAGLQLSDLSGYFDKGELPLFRIIPNTAIEVLQGVSVISFINASEIHQSLVISLFEELGKVFLIPESQMNAYMSLTSCGIAFAFRYIRASVEGAVEMGISPDTAKEAVMQTLKGAVGLLDENKSHPEAEIDKVTTPGGFTIKGLNEMEAHGFSNAVIKGLKASNADK